MDREYFVLSISHTDCSRPYIVLWAADDSGHRGRIESAGRYSEAQIKQRLDYYNNGCDTVAIPCDVAESLAFAVRPGFFDDSDVRTMVLLGLQIGFDPKRDLPFDGERHHALADAIHQARYVSAIWKRLLGTAAYKEADE